MKDFERIDKLEADLKLMAQVIRNLSDLLGHVLDETSMILEQNGRLMNELEKK